MTKTLAEDPTAFDFNDYYQPAQRPTVPGLGHKSEIKSSRFIEKMKNQGVKRELE